ncbi:hypothetical protein BDV95DRAFT_620199 [Massariosphaeria phaeospora]|uniref:EGF-like domain-containing protein n=1 Tax=Massariosphaeria phaeospora TaxID=100035 RepID=A0A7C8I342_9PLEO|nr:hypothetical protein BDV95DRAFT_620199 [Massariosphaeria phaeospora]
MRLATLLSLVLATAGFVVMAAPVEGPQDVANAVGVNGPEAKDAQQVDIIRLDDSTIANDIADGTQTTESANSIVCGIVSSRWNNNGAVRYEDLHSSDPGECRSLEWSTVTVQVNSQCFCYFYGSRDCQSQQWTSIPILGHSTWRVPQTVGYRCRPRRNTAARAVEGTREVVNAAEANAPEANDAQQVDIVQLDDAEVNDIFDGTATAGAADSEYCGVAYSKWGNGSIKFENFVPVQGAICNNLLYGSTTVRVWTKCACNFYGSFDCNSKKHNTSPVVGFSTWRVPTTVGYQCWRI